MVRVLLRTGGSEIIFGTHFIAIFKAELHKSTPISSGWISCAFLALCNRNSRGSGVILAAQVLQAHLKAHSSPWGSWAGHRVCPAAHPAWHCVPRAGGQQEHRSSVQAGCAGSWRNPALRQAALQVPSLLQAAKALGSDRWHHAPSSNYSSFPLRGLPYTPADPSAWWCNFGIVPFVSDVNFGRQQQTWCWSSPAAASLPFPGHLATSSGVLVATAASSLLWPGFCAGGGSRGLAVSLLIAGSTHMSGGALYMLRNCCQTAHLGLPSCSPLVTCQILSHLTRI